MCNIKENILYIFVANIQINTKIVVDWWWVFVVSHIFQTETENREKQNYFYTILLL